VGGTGADARIGENKRELNPANSFFGRIKSDQPGFTLIRFKFPERRQPARSAGWPRLGIGVSRIGNPPEDRVAQGVRIPAGCQPAIQPITNRRYDIPLGILTWSHSGISRATLQYSSTPTTHSVNCQRTFQAHGRAKFVRRTPQLGARHACDKDSRIASHPCSLQRINHNQTDNASKIYPNPVPGRISPSSERGHSCHSCPLGRAHTPWRTDHFLFSIGNEDHDADRVRSRNLTPCLQKPQK